MLNTIKIIRYTISYVFLISGTIKMFDQGIANHFVQLQLPYPLKMLHVVAIIEIVCGLLILLNKWVINATIPLMMIMIAAILLTKIPYLHTGFLQFAFQSRLDIVMLVLLILLYRLSSNRF